MDKNLDLKELERKAFRSTFQDGLWDIFLGLIFTQFAIAPLLTDIGMGDLGSSAVFVPVYILAFLLLRYGKKYITLPRMGLVRYGNYRKKSIKKMIFLCNIMLFLGLIAGLFAFTKSDIKLSEWIFPGFFSAMLLLGFSMAAYYLKLSRLFLYGLLLSFSIPIGELLYRYEGASHHGFPIVFSIASITIISIGVVLLIRFLRNYPNPTTESADVQI